MGRRVDLNWDEWNPGLDTDDMTLPSVFIGSMVSTAGNKLVESLNGLLAMNSVFIASGNLGSEVSGSVGLQTYIDGSDFE